MGSEMCIRDRSSSAETSAKWLRDRLGDSVNGDIFLATSDDADRFGIDIS